MAILRICCTRRTIYQLAVSFRSIKHVVVVWIYIVLTQVGSYRGPLQVLCPHLSSGRRDIDWRGLLTPLFVYTSVVTNKQIWNAMRQSPCVCWHPFPRKGSASLRLRPVVATQRQTLVYRMHWNSTRPCLPYVLDGILHNMRSKNRPCSNAVWTDCTRIACHGYLMSSSSTRSCLLYVFE